MEDSYELERALLAGLPEHERRQTVESIRAETAKRLEQLRRQVGHEAQETH